MFNKTREIKRLVKSLTFFTSYSKENRSTLLLTASMIEFKSMKNNDFISTSPI